MSNRKEKISNMLANYFYEEKREKHCQNDTGCVKNIMYFFSFFPYRLQYFSTFIDNTKIIVMLSIYIKKSRKGNIWFSLGTFKELITGSHSIKTDLNGYRDASRDLNHSLVRLNL